MSDFDVHAGERARHLMMAALDGELSRQEQADLERLLRDDPALRAEWQRLQRVKEVTTTMSLREPPREVWDRYWLGVYQRFERGLAWILVSFGAIVVLSWGSWEVLRELWNDQQLPVLVKAGSFALVVGVVILAVSVIREKLFVYRTDPYKDVIR
jgi:ferric-dicitrate binding protein FerR (iron transport regulator)